MLNTDEMIFTRSEDGELISQEVELEGLPNKPTVRIKPLTRGKLQELYAKATGTEEQKAQADGDIIKDGLVEPVLKEEQIKDLKPQFAAAISTAILSVSTGLTQAEVTAQAENLITLQEAELKKN